MTGVPTALHHLGEAFVPIPPWKKGTRRPRTPENLFEATDPVLEAYLEAGHNYGVTCRGDLIVLDADDPDGLADAIDALPETAWQVSGSGEGEHYFLEIPGIDEDLKLFDPETNAHLGEVKGAEQSYVVGPGSSHPSGGTYGPIQGDRVATVDEETFRELVEPYLRSSAAAGEHRPVAGPEAETRAGGTPQRDTAVSVYDVVSRRRYPEGGRAEHPFHGSDTGANFMVDDGAETWRCWRHDCTGNALHLVGIEQGIISCGDWQGGGLDTDTWSEIFEAAREAGYDVGEPQARGDGGQAVAALPGAPTLPERVDAWDWRRAGAVDDPVERAREQTTDTIADVLGSGERVLLEALPTLGKSFGTVRAVARTGEPATVLTTRGRTEQYAQLQEWAREEGLDAYTLPAFTHDCDTATGEHGAEWRERVMDWYRRGATPKEIHKHAEAELGNPLPCQAGEHSCPYTLKWDFDPEEFDLLLGHYSHAHKRKVTSGRTVVVDEFPEGAYETRLGHGLEGAISHFLQSHDALPFDDYTDLVEGRHDEQRRSDALLWFEGRDLERDGRQVFGDQKGHAAAPQAVYTILAGAGKNLGNGWERAPFGDGSRVGLFDREQGEVWLLTPPPIEGHRGVVGLDGTPTKDLWELTVGTPLDHRIVLDDDERREYLTDGLGLQFVRTTEAIKPYNSPDHVAVDQDAALLEAVRDQHGERPDLITTSAALDEYEGADVLDDVDETGYYGNILGSNQFGESRLGAVVGSNHYGDGYVEKWAAYAGATAKRGREKGAGLTYGTFGDQVLTHMREHDTLQAALRFGRDGQGAVVYVHTDTLPEWVPVAAEGRVLTTWSEGMRQVLEAIQDHTGEWTSAEIAEHPAVEVGERQVRTHLATLAEEHSVLRREIDGCGYVYREDGLHRVTDHGDVELEPVDLGALDAAESAEVARSTTHTWDLRTSPPHAEEDGVSAAAGGNPGAPPAAVEGDPPPGGGK